MKLFLFLHFIPLSQAFYIASRRHGQADSLSFTIVTSVTNTYWWCILVIIITTVWTKLWLLLLLLY